MSLIETIKRILFSNKHLDIEDEDTDSNIERTMVTLEDEQKRITDLYESEGLTDDLLEKQVELNVRRSKLDIPDKNHLDDGWSQ